MPRFILLSCLLLISSHSYAADSWFDSALDFLGLGEDEEETTQSIEVKPATPTPSNTEALTAAATNALTSGAVTASLTSMITGQLGVTDTQAKGGLGSLFGLAKSSLGSQDFSQLSSVVPEMDTLLAAAPAISENAKGLSSLMGSAGKYGQALQGATQAYSQFKQLGIGVDKIPAYINVTNDFLKSQGSDDAATLFQKGVSALLTSED
tara:strand:+ start:10194 stop:10817 length:624 start_codon:yes stop_codon:yes gene_type:complete